MGSCRTCGKELSQDSFVFVESSKESEVIARFHATLSRKTKIRDSVKNGAIPKADARCFECAQLIIEELDGQIREAEFERDSYLRYLQHSESETLEEEKASLALEIQKLEDEERSILELLEQAQAERSSAKQVLEECRKEALQVDALEREYWERFASYQLVEHNLREEHELIARRNQYGDAELRRLEQKNVYQDTFYISTSGRIGTINGFRLGKLPDTPVEWEEINAAWGQVTLLLYIISKKGGFSLKGYRLRPMGNRSTIEETVKDGVISKDLWGSDDLGFGSWFWGFGKKTTNTFDDGMVAFLQCLGEVCRRVEHQSPELSLPYSVNGEKIGSQPIRMQSTTEESWTKALKHVLTNVNFLLAWISSKNVKR